LAAHHADETARSTRPIYVSIDALSGVLIDHTGSATDNRRYVVGLLSYLTRDNPNVHLHAGTQRLLSFALSASDAHIPGPSHAVTPTAASISIPSTSTLCTLSSFTTG